jgi:hypothetical protein
VADREFPLDLLHALSDIGIEDSVTPLPVGSALEREMHDASERTLRRARRTRQHPRSRWVAPVLGTAVAAAVAVLAITLLSHRSQDLRQGSAAPRPVSQRFAVLRRAQTARDRLPLGLQQHVAVQDGGRVLPRLTRLIASPGTARVFLVVLVPGHAGSGSPLQWSAGLGDQVALVAVNRGRWQISRAIPASVIARAVDLTSVVTEPDHSAQGDHVFLVPDRVARVRLATIARDGRIVAARTASVRDNAAVFSDPLISVPRNLGTIRVDLSAKVSWYSATGAVIPTSDTAEP